MPYKPLFCLLLHVNSLPRPVIFRGSHRHTWLDHRSKAATSLQRFEITDANAERVHASRGNAVSAYMEVAIYFMREVAQGRIGRRHGGKSLRVDGNLEGGWMSWRWDSWKERVGTTGNAEGKGFLNAVRCKMGSWKIWRERRG